MSIFEKISNKSVPDNAANVWIIVYMLVMPVVVSLVTALVQMTISMFTNPMIGMLACYGMECYVSIYKQSAYDRK